MPPCRKRSSTFRISASSTFTTLRRVRCRAVCRRETHACRPRSCARRTPRSERHSPSWGHARQAFQRFAIVRHLAAELVDQFVRQGQHVLRLGSEEADGFDEIADFVFAERHHFYGGIGGGEQRLAGLLTPTSVACADSATATTSVKGLM